VRAPCDDDAVAPRIRSFVLRLAVPAVAAAILAGFSAASAGAESEPVTPTTIYGYDLENDPSQCIGFLPKPNCGREPRDSGDRGGALQYAVFGVLMAGVATVGTVVARSVIRRDRALAVSAPPPE